MAPDNLTAAWRALKARATETRAVSLRALRDADPARTIRWSALGACLPADAFPEGTTGHFRIQPSDWLPQVLRLPAVVLANERDDLGNLAWLRFENLSPGLETALERHLFRVHRREIAERRRPR